MDYGTLHHKKTTTYNGEEIKDMLTLTFIDPDEYDYTIFRVPAEYIARPDLISIDHYGSDRYTDIICKINGISNPFELNEGDLLTLPGAGSLNRFIYRADNIQQSNDGSDQKPKPKTRKEKRKANEAIVGDKRFKIDKNRRIVIY